MRNVAETGEPILLDIMELGGEQLVVTRMPIEDEERNVIGAIGFVLYDQIESLKPLLARVTQLESDLRLARRQLSERPRGALHLRRFRRHDAGNRAGQGDSRDAPRGRT